MMLGKIIEWRKYKNEHCDFTKKIMSKKLALLSDELRKASFLLVNEEKWQETDAPLICILFLVLKRWVLLPP